MEMTRVWNISDHPDSSAEAGVLMVLGRSVAPGRYVQVSVDRLKNAHQVRKDETNGLLHIGMKLPVSYLAHKKPVRVTLPKGVERSHGGEIAAVAIDAPSKVEAVLVDTTVEDGADPTLAEPPKLSTPPVEEEKPEEAPDEGKGFGRKKKNRGK